MSAELIGVGKKEITLSLLMLTILICMTRMMSMILNKIQNKGRGIRIEGEM